MSKVSLVQRNKKREKLFRKYAKKRIALQTVANDESLSMEERFNARLSLAELPRNSAKCRQRLRCSLTGRPRGNYKQFGICRNKFRELASKGMISGVTKASW